MEFSTKWRRPPVFVLSCDDTDIVERAGYVPVKEQVERLRTAGLNLFAQRAEQYDGEDAEMMTVDPTRNMDKFDEADYFKSADRYLYEKALGAKEARKAALVEKQKKEAEKLPNDSKKEVVENE